MSALRSDLAVLQHGWNVSEEEAIEIQTRIASLALRTDAIGDVRRIAGVDVAYDDSNFKLFAAVVVLDAKTGETVEIGKAVGKVEFPYIPGLFAFRELPHLLAAMKTLNSKPDLVICDGQGLAHPRRCGLATPLGVMADVPTIGCGKTRHIGEFGNLDNDRGAATPLCDGDEVIGKVVRTQDGVKPLFVSIGHRVSLETAVDWILKLSSKFRQPEPIRRANEVVCQMRSDQTETARS